MAANVNKKNKGMGIHARRALAYIVLVIISFFCLFWFYVMIINATRSNGELQAGFIRCQCCHLIHLHGNYLFLPQNTRSLFSLFYTRFPVFLQAKSATPGKSAAFQERFMY